MESNADLPIITRLRNSSLVLLGRTSNSWDLGITPEGSHDKTQTVNHADCADHAACADRADCHTGFGKRSIMP